MLKIKLIEVITQPGLLTFHCKNENFSQNVEPSSKLRVSWRFSQCLSINHVERVNISRDKIRII